MITFYPPLFHRRSAGTGMRDRDSFIEYKMALSLFENLCVSENVTKS